MMDAEKAAKKRAEEAIAIAELKNAGVNMDQVPAEEVEEGGGEVMTVLSMWVRTLQRLRTSESSSQASLERAAHLETVLKEVQRWRDEKAKQLRISPAAVLPDFLAMKIIHARATDTEALTAAGVRILSVDELAALMLSHFPPASAVSNSGDDGQGPSEGKLILPEGQFAAKNPWMHAVYKVCSELVKDTCATFRVRTNGSSIFCRLGHTLVEQAPRSRVVSLQEREKGRGKGGGESGETPP